MENIQDGIPPEEQFLDTRQFLEETSIYNMMPSEQTDENNFSCEVSMSYQQNAFDPFPTYPIEQYMPGSVDSSQHNSLPTLYEDLVDTKEDTITAGRRYTEGSIPKIGKRQKRRKSTEPMTEQRRQFLERNRIAALKCRQRKKEWLTDLQNRVEFLATDNEQLQSQASLLKEEVINLKTLLLAHKDCKVAQANGTTVNAIHGALLPSTSSSSSTTDTSGNTFSSTKSLLNYP